MNFLELFLNQRMENFDDSYDISTLEGSQRFVGDVICVYLGLDGEKEVQPYFFRHMLKNVIIDDWHLGETGIYLPENISVEKIDAWRKNTSSQHFKRYSNLVEKIAFEGKEFQDLGLRSESYGDLVREIIGEEYLDNGSLPSISKDNSKLTGFPPGIPNAKVFYKDRDRMLDAIGESFEVVVPEVIYEIRPKD